MSTQIDTTPAGIDLEKFRSDWEAWHAEREAELGDPKGWLSVFARI